MAVKDGMMQAGAIFVEVKDKKQGERLRPLTPEHATKMVLEHIRDVPRTMERQEKAKKHCVSVFSGSGRVEEDLFKEGKPFDFLHEKNYDTIRDMAKKKFISLGRNVIVEEKLVGVADSKQEATWGAGKNVIVEEKLVGVADSKREATRGAGKLGLLNPKRKNANKENGTRKRDKQNEENQIKPLPNKRPAEDTSSRQKKQKDDDELTKVKEELNSAIKEKEDALKLVASMKTDITRKEEEIEKREQEIKSRDTDIANKDQQLKSALDEIAERDKDIAKKDKQLEQLESIKRILNPATDDEGEPATKRTRTEDTTKKPKIMSVLMNSEHTDCSICCAKFSADLDSKDDNIRKHLPILSSSKTCDHYFCHGCILKQQAAIAEENSGRVPKWIPCMVCKTKTAFCPSEPKYHRLLIGILKKAKWTDAPQVKEELVD